MADSVLRIAAAPDSYKGSLSSLEAAYAIRAGVRRAVPDAVVSIVPIADGGEGTLDAVLAATNASRIDRNVTGPEGIPLAASFGLLAGSPMTAFVEMAQAAGLGLVPQQRRNPAVMTTYGVGELILAAIENGARRVVIGLGGSCTNDGGAGALQALGVRFLDRRGCDLAPLVTASDLSRLASIDGSGLSPLVRDVEFVLASDVTNPLLGALGASAVFSPQKGADSEQIIELERSLGKFADVVLRDIGIDISSLPGGGAAGGMGAGFMAVLGAKVCSGIDMILDIVGFDQIVAAADYVFTGEGRIDTQTLRGKAVAGVFARSAALHVPVVAFGGSVDSAVVAELFERGLTTVSITDETMTLDYAFENAFALLEDAAERITRELMSTA